MNKNQKIFFTGWFILCALMVIVLAIGIYKAIGPLFTREGRDNLIERVHDEYQHADSVWHQDDRHIQR